VSLDAALRERATEIASGNWGVGSHIVDS